MNPDRIVSIGLLEQPALDLRSPATAFWRAQSSSAGTSSIRPCSTSTLLMISGMRFDLAPRRWSPRRKRPSKARTMQVHVE